MLTRRRLLAMLGTTAGWIATGCSAPKAAPTPPEAGPDEGTPGASAPVPAPADTKTVLVLGGTGFLGPHFVRAAQERGYTVTLFNRGKTNTHLFPDLEKIRGERGTDMSALAAAVNSGRRWDAVIDTSGYVPRVVRESAELLAEATDRYVFISSISVYKDPTVVGIAEDAAVGTIDDPTIEEVNGETYGPLKALCEQVSEEVYGARATVIRPGLIVGPGDPTDRYTYWPVRCARGGELIAPGTPQDPTQIIDARDLAAFMVECLEGQVSGRFNAAGPAEKIDMETMIGACITAAGSDATPVWIPAAFLEEQEVAPWMHMPAWVPPDGEAGGLLQVSIAAARAKGLTFRSIEDTARDTLAWWSELPQERREKPRAGLPADREAEVLAAWKKAQKKGWKPGKKQAKDKGDAKGDAKSGKKKAA